MRLLAAAILSSAAAAIVGCGAGGSPTCSVIQAFGVAPLSASADHAAAAPGNQVQFTGAITYKATSSGCAVPALARLAYPSWTNPDPLDITISSAADSSNGTAVCTHPTSGPVTLTANAGPLVTPSTVTVQLTCQ